MSRPVAYDVTHLVSRMAARGVTGIDRIDLAFGRHIAAAPNIDAVAAYCRRGAPGVMAAPTLRKIVRRAHLASWDDGASSGSDPSFSLVRDWLGGALNQPDARPATVPLLGLGPWLAARYWAARCRGARGGQGVPGDAVYLNIAEHWLEYPEYFDWLDNRPDVRAIFFIHDLLPLDYPEYFRPGYEAVFQRRFATITRHGTGFIVSTHVVGERLRAALAATRRKIAPIHVAPLPSPLGSDAEDPAVTAWPPHPYFVVVSTVEPRKNHLLLLNIWRELAARLGEQTPRLVLVGSRGWENEQVIDMLERCPPIAKHVFRVTRLSRQGLAWLVRHAQALLMPSFDEGYGLPVVEALGLGTPVIASDIATFREVAGDCATLLSPIDGKAWAEAVVALSRCDTASWRAAKAQALSFRAPTWESYFAGVDQFLRTLP